MDENLLRVLIEGVELNVCGECSRFGKILAPVHRPGPKEQHKHFQRNMQAKEKEEKIEMIVENYAEIIKKKREATGLSQKDFANKISEKESTLHHIETGTLEPSLSLAKKLEKILAIKLIESHEEHHELIKKSKEEGFTLGDFIRVRK